MFYFPYEIDQFLALAQFFMLYMGFVIALLFLMRRRRRRLQQLRQDQEQTLESKLRQLGESSARAAELSSQVTLELDAMTAAASKAKADADEAQRLAKLSESDRKAVAALVRKELGTELKGRDRKSIWVNVGLSAMFFVLGVVSSIVVTLTVRPSEPEPEPTSQSVSMPLSVSEAELFPVGGAPTT